MKTQGMTHTFIAALFAIACAVALMGATATQAFAADYFESSQNLGVFVGAEPVPPQEPADKEYGDSSSLGAETSMDMGIYVGDGSDEDITGGDDKTYQDPSTVGADTNVNLGIYVGVPPTEDDPQVTTPTVNEDGATIDASTNLGIYIGDTSNDSIDAPHQTINGNAAGEAGVNTNLGIYIGNDDDLASTVTPDLGSFGTTVDNDVNLGIYIGNDDDLTQTETPDPGSVGTEVDTDVDLGIYVGGSVDVETGDGETNASTTLAIRVVNPDEEPNVNEEGKAQVVFQLGNAAGATWANGSTTVSSNFLTIDPANPTKANTQVPGNGMPTANHYELTGWSVSTDDASAPTALGASELDQLELKGNHSYTITAQWQGAEYKVNMDVDGGTLTIGATQTFRYPDSYELPTFPVISREGYTFKGWLVNGSVVTSVNAPMAPAGTNVIAAVAQWESVYVDPDDPEPVLKEEWHSISFDIDTTNAVDGGAVTSTYPTIYVPRNAAGKYPVTETMPAFTDTGKDRFYGWYANSKYTGDVITWPAELTEDVTYYGYWASKEGHLVTFDPNGGTLTSTSKDKLTVPAGRTISTDDEATVEKRSGYMFVGWFPKDDKGAYGKQWVFGDTGTPVNAPTTLYAKWNSIVNVDVPVQTHIQLVKTGNDANSIVVNAKTFGQFQNRTDTELQIVDVAEADINAYNSTLKGNGQSVLKDNYGKTYLTILAKTDGTAVAQNEGAGIDLQNSSTFKYTYATEDASGNKVTQTMDMPAWSYTVDQDLSTFTADEAAGKWWIYKYKLDQSADWTKFNGAANGGVMVIPAASISATTGKLTPGVLPVYYGLTFDGGFDIRKADLDQDVKHISSLMYTVQVK